MNKFLSAFLIAIIGMSCLLISTGLKGKGDVIIHYVEEFSNQCKSLPLLCDASSSILKELHNSGAGIKRKSITKDELPIVRIYMNDGAVGKLDSKRKSVLSKPRPIHIAEDDDWVKATIIVEYADKKERSKVSLRLKGDWGDHLEHPKKLSFRVKTRAGGYLFGMKSFSIQHPMTRNYGREPLLLDHMRQNDILAPRYSFTDVYINDFPIGVMALEEHFRKEMIEAQNRRDGPLLAINEDPVWDQWNINYNGETPAGGGGFNFIGLRDSMIKDFNKSKFERGTIPTNNAIRGHALLRDFLNGKLSSRETFDYEKLSKHWILVNIWGGCHSSVWHNRRFYFNPISGLLEPVSFDNIPNPQHFKICSGFDVKAALQDPQFLTQLNVSADEIYQQLQSEDFHTTLMEKQVRQSAIFDYEGFPNSLTDISQKLLIDNLRQLLSSVFENYDSYGLYSKAYVPQKQNLVGLKFLQEQKDLNLHMASFYFPEDVSGNFQFRNLTLKPVKITNVYVAGKKGKQTHIEIPATEVLSGALVEIPVNIAANILRKHSEFVVRYEYEGEMHERPVYVQLRNSPDGFLDNSIEAIRKTDGHKWVDVAGKQVVFAAGPHNFKESIFLPKGWRVIIQAGAEMNFQNGALLKLQGPLLVRGTEALPVKMNVESHLSFRDMGSWGGLVVSKSLERSTVNYLVLNGTGTQNLATRQGFYGMTGCLSFYESDVDITNSSFVNAQCEDALNVVKSDFTFDNITIDRARADAFDSDFSTGLISNSKFTASGNDGVDVSGTFLSLSNITMQDIGDKAISVGEKSSLRAEDIQISGAVLGIVSKDRSDAVAKRVTFENISGTAIMTYIKKQEYGPSEAECSDCSFIGNFTQTGAQESTKITLNGDVIHNSSLTKKQMYEAGLIEEEG